MKRTDPDIRAEVPTKGQSDAFLSDGPQGAVLNIKVLPNASKSYICDVQGGCLRIKIASAPVKGKANKECQRFLAAFFRIKRSQVIFIRGETNRLKQVLLQSLSKEDVLKRLKDDRTY